LQTSIKQTTSCNKVVYNNTHTTMKFIQFAANLLVLSAASSPLAAYAKSSDDDTKAAPAVLLKPKQEDDVAPAVVPSSTNFLRGAVGAAYHFIVTSDGEDEGGEGKDFMALGLACEEIGSTSECPGSQVCQWNLAQGNTCCQKKCMNSIGYPQGCSSLPVC
jgi:hypothetical protein